MPNKDKLLAGFLVTAGLFSFAQAVQYIGQLSDIQKAEMVLLASDEGVVTVTEPPRVVNDNKKIG